jgi:hypothetical protein
MMDLLLLPPLVRFFLGLSLVLVITAGAVLFSYWLMKKE